MAARLEAPRAGVRPVTVTAPARRAGLAAAAHSGRAGHHRRRLPGVCPGALAIHANRHAAFAHAAQLWQAERRMHLRNEPRLTGLAAPRPALAEVSDRHLVQAIRRLARPGHPRAGSSI
jgi:hypothetical protein